MKRMSIKHQLRITTLIPVLVAALLFAIFYNGQLKKDQEQRMLKIGESYVRQLLPSAQMAMMRHDLRTLQGLIDASSINPEIKSLAFYNAKGFLVAYRGGKHAMNKPFKPLQFTGDYIATTKLGPYLIQFIAPVTLPKLNLYSRMPNQTPKDLRPIKADDILGWLSIELNTKLTLIKRYQMYIATIFISLIGLLISLTIHYFLSQRISLPLSRLKRSMLQVLSNHFNEPVQTKSSGDLGIIERGFAHLQQEYLNTVRDLNQQVEVATADLHQSLELLEEKNIELSMEKRKSEERSAQKSEFIANMSHEIRTPMNGIIGFTNVLLESQLNPLQLDYVKTIKSSAQDLLTIISDILDYSKMEAGKLRLDCIPLDIRACVDEVLALQAPNAHKKGLDVIPSTAIEVPKMILGDPLRIKQILTNLVCNAVKFTDHGHVQLSTTVEREDEHDISICFEISDTGIGISAEDQHKLFHAFHQGDTTITRRFGGTGLGLVICKKLTETMNGRIGITSNPNAGTTFSVHIKLEKFKSREAEKSNNARFVNVRALCYDDNILCLDSMRHGLKYWGVDCDTVNSVEEFEKMLAKKNRYKLAFIGVNEKIESRIPRLFSEYHIPVVLVSKWLIHDPIQLGAKTFLFKPVSIQKLYDALETCIYSNAHQHLRDPDLQQLHTQLRQIYPTILIAEDNPVNRMLMNSLLSEHAQVTLVEHGLQAVEAAMQHRYHLILLDLQMPHLDGLKAAQTIRLKSLHNRLTPIVVITANCHEMDLKVLHEQGIDACLPKPVDQTALLSQLLDLLKKAKTPVIDWQLCLQRVSGKQRLAEDYLKAFIEELNNNRAEFITLFAERNAQKLKEVAHKLNGACSFCGVPKLHQLVVQLEKDIIKNQPFDEIKTHFTILIQAMDDVLNEYQAIYMPLQVEDVVN